MPSKLGYRNRSARLRFDGKFEVQLRPRVLKCKLTAEDWGLADFTAVSSIVTELNLEVTEAINTCDTEAEIAQRIAARVARLPLAIARKNTILHVVERLLRAAFD
jgi:hypothetical protein